MRLDWQRRAAVLFAASLFVVSVVLVFFAVREAEREKLLKEREIESERARTAEAVAGRAESLIAEAESRVLQALRRDPGRLDPVRLASVSEGLVADIPLLSEAFFIDDAGQAGFLTSKPLFLIPGERPRARDLTSAFENEKRWTEAEEAEFRREDFSRAVAIYRELAAKTADPALNSLLLNRMGRCYLKWGRDDQALAAYREQIETGSPDLTSDGIPLGITALHQIGNIHLKRGREADAAGAFLEIYRGLLDSRWPLTKSQFELFLDGIESRVRGLAGQTKDPAHAEWAEKFDELRKIERARRAKTAILEKVLERIVPLMKLEAGEPEGEYGRFKHAAESTDAGLLLVSILPLNDGAVLGLLSDPEVLAKGLLAPGSETSRSREGWSIEIVDGAGMVRTADGPPGRAGSKSDDERRLVFSGVFPGSFPPWAIHIYQTGVDAAEREFRSRRNIYILTLVVVITALFFGGYLAIRSTAKELKLARLKSDFVATVSHEFRTPLTSIRYMAELLQRGRVPQAERRQRYYETITGESERLGRLVENLLDFSKIEAGMKEYRMEETDVAALAAETASRFRQQAVLQEFRLETEIAGGMPGIRADRESLSRAVFNLLDNAVKYSGGNPRIVLRAWSRGDHVCLQVEDEGIGISRAEQKYIFDKFYRSRKAMESNIKGSGIGLPLIDHIVRAHGGKVLLDSEPGKGTRVTIELPISPAGERKGKNDG